MTSVLPIRPEMRILHNFSGYLLSDIGHEITVSFPQVGRAAAVWLFLSKIVNSTFRPEIKPDCPADLNEVAFRLMSDTSRALRLVIRREPKPYRPFESEPSYLLCYVIEQLECGHSLTAYPQADPLIAKRRLCQKCQELHKEMSLPPKKPARSVKAEKAKVMCQGC